MGDIEEIYTKRYAPGPRGVRVMVGVRVRFRVRVRVREAVRADAVEARCGLAQPSTHRHGRHHQQRPAFRPVWG